MADSDPQACSFCREYASHVCKRCGRAYCNAHGREFCEACLDPAGALPSQRLYRGSLLALAVGAFTGLLVLIHPLSLPGEHRLARTGAQNPAAVQPGPGPLSRSGTAAVPTPVPAGSASPTAPALHSYTVVLNDTLSGIAQSFGTTVAAIQAANPGVSQSILKPGQELLIPPPEATPEPAASATPTVTPAP